MHNTLLSISIFFSVLIFCYKIGVLVYDKHVFFSYKKNLKEEEEEEEDLN